MRDLPGTGENGQRFSGRGCSVCSSATCTFASESIMRWAHVADVACSGRAALGCVAPAQPTAQLALVSVEQQLVGT
eukprot:CAMPEP_0119064508 /NCGR_PEP_ID=MMETSP1178-20130426/7582_1 /TAXON_ID=33656 /ORGANISM="unid sp, Strain CCMP2000" /LENGTH=75 /DNA_ID=CAMNT_0007045955 /DNA_START=170 /DNA_END=397 /DNA_ORIENTATION=-